MYFPNTELRIAVGNVSRFRCEADCRSGVSEFDPRPVPYFRGDNEIIPTVILHPFAESFMKGCCQLQAKVGARITGQPLVQACPGKKCG